MNILKKIIRKNYKRLRRVPDRFFWFLKINKVFKKSKIDSADGFWEKDYKRAFLHHSHQNKLISSDFIKNIKNKEIFYKTILNSKKLLDFGCGTGEFSFFIDKKFKNIEIIGVDISKTAVESAQYLYGKKNIKFIKIKPDEDFKKIGNFDLVVCSQVLEHFSKPSIILDKLFQISNQVIVIVPYKQGEIAKCLEDGGAEHVSRFDDYSFGEYNVLSNFIFSTLGWDYSNKGEKPLQIAFLLRKNKL